MPNDLLDRVKTESIKRELDISSTVRELIQERLMEIDRFNGRPSTLIAGLPDKAPEQRHTVDPGGICLRVSRQLATHFTNRVVMDAIAKELWRDTSQGGYEWAALGCPSDGIMSIYRDTDDD